MDGGKNQKWMTLLRDYMIKNRINHTFWCLNPNSGDTGGLIGNDWSTWDEEKYGLLKPALWQANGKFIGLDHQIPLGKNGMSLGQYYGDGPIIVDPVLLGDVNDDGNVDALDLAAMKRYLLGINPEINVTNSDMNSDGDINSIDFALLKSSVLSK